MHRAENASSQASLSEIRYMVLVLRTNDDLIHEFPAEVSGEVKVSVSD